MTRPTLLASLLTSLLATAAVSVLTGCPSTQPAARPAKPTVVLHEPPPDAPPPLVLDDATRDAVDELIMGMYIDDIAVRRESAEALGVIGPDARGALPELIECAGTDTPAEEPVAVCAHSIIEIASGRAPAPMTALVHAFQIPLATKERALAALGELGGLASPALAAIYVDACERMTAADRPLGQHLEHTAAAAVNAMALAPASARAVLLDEQFGDCGAQGAEAISVVAAR